MCSYRWSSVSSTRASSSLRRWGTAGPSSPSPPPWLRRRVASRWWARSRPPRRPSGWFGGWRWGRPCPAARRSTWSRRTPRARAPCGATCSTGSRGSGRPWSPIAPGWPASSRSRSRASTAATSPGCCPPRGGRSGREPGWGRRRAASAPTPRRCGPAHAAPARRGRSGGPIAIGPSTAPCHPRGGRGARLAGVPRPAAGGPPAHPAGAPGAARDPRAAGDQDPGRARRACPRGRWPSASGTRACWRSTWPAGATRRWSPRRPPEPVLERLDLPEAASGQQLERGLDLLVGRVLARRERRGRSLRSLAMSARFVTGGTWRLAVTLRRASADPARIHAVARPAAGRAAGAGGVDGARGRGLRPAGARPGAAARRGGGGAAGRAWARPFARPARRPGADAALRILDVDPGSRIPERRAMLAPFPDWPAP